MPANDDETIANDPHVTVAARKQSDAVRRAYHRTRRSPENMLLPKSAQVRP